MDKFKLLVSTLFLSAVLPLGAQSKISKEEIISTMLKATQFMVEKVSYKGGYVWSYETDFSRQWGEMEAYKTMIWMQHPGTISMGHVFLDAYKATADEYYYQAAHKVAEAIMLGQGEEGGWNYMVDFAGEDSIKKWYNTIGKNGWRLEEFQHYYGNATFDDDVTSDAARFLLRIYLVKHNPAYKPALDKAISFILESQYPAGGWPQRYPLKYDFNKGGHEDYTSFYTFNDDVIWENTHFLIQCYQLLGDRRFLEPIQRGMNFYLISQDSCGAWGQQLNMKMETAGARTYEPAAFLPKTTCENALLLLKFYEFTGDKKFLQGVPAAINWLEKTKLPADKAEGERTHSTFVEVGTNRPIYAHRKGSNVKYGFYYIDYDDKQLLSHYYGKATVPLEELKAEYKRLSELSNEEVVKNSPLKIASFVGEGESQYNFDLNGGYFKGMASEEKINEILTSLDGNNRWLSRRAYISNPYIGDGINQEQTDIYAMTRVGDETDTSPFPDTSGKLYISTGTYIRNMNMLLSYLESNKSLNQF